jgi:hypothetical protein
MKLLRVRQSILIHFLFSSKFLSCILQCSIQYLGDWQTPPSSPDPYPLWARDKNSLLMWHDIHLKKGHGRDYNFSFPLLSLFQKTTTSSETSLSEDSLQAFISLSERSLSFPIHSSIHSIPFHFVVFFSFLTLLSFLRFAQNKIDTIIQHFSPWAAAVLEGWCEHCVRRGICWTLEDVVPLHSKITGVGSFFYNPSRNKEIEEYGIVTSTHSSLLFLSMHLDNISVDISLIYCYHLSVDLNIWLTWSDLYTTYNSPKDLSK